MGHAPSGQRQYELTYLWGIHREIVRLAATGLRHNVIAATLGVSEVMVSYTLNSSIVKQELERVHAERDASAADVGGVLRGMAQEAAEKLGEHMRSGASHISLAASRDILDRAGYPAVKQTQVLGAVAHLTADEIRQLRENAKAAGVSIVEADYEEEEEVREASGV